IGRMPTTSSASTGGTGRLEVIEILKPTAADRPPPGDRWIHEVKYDGYRTQLVIQYGRVRAYTKSGHDWSSKYAPVTEAAAKLPCSSAIIDGEIVVNDERGISDFKALASSIGRRPHLLQFV